MNRIFFTVAVLAVLTTATATAQTRRWMHQIGIEVGPQFALPSSLATIGGSKLEVNGMGTGIGGALNYYYQFEDPHFFFSGSIAAGIFSQGNITRNNANGIVTKFDFSRTGLLNLAFTAGGRYNFALSGLQPYVGVEVGLYTIGYTDFQPLPTPSGDDSPNLAITPKVGLRYPLARGIDLDGSVKLMYMFSGRVPFSYVSTNIGVSFAIGQLLD